MIRRDVEIRRVFILTGRTDMRRGITGLVSLVRLHYGLDPLEKGTLFLFCGRKKDRIKCLMYEGDGFVLASKRLTCGRYCWPDTASQARCLTWEEYDRFMDGFTIESSIRSDYPAQPDSSIRPRR
ncbi:MAG: IS66 family insertion sequence element accessory protein TnpB [Planctomycetaceae bacterium]|nr:IS66 family insertion sequence element accessory protein TnpB [Planctomycetaceae bacterium]